MEPLPEVQAAIQKYVVYLLDKSHWDVYGINRLVLLLSLFCRSFCGCFVAHFRVFRTGAAHWVHRAGSGRSNRPVVHIRTTEGGGRVQV